MGSLSKSRKPKGIAKYKTVRDLWGHQGLSNTKTHSRVECVIISISTQAEHVICVMVKVAMVVEILEYCPERGTVANFSVSWNSLSERV